MGFVLHPVAQCCKCVFTLVRKCFSVCGCKLLHFVRESRAHHPMPLSAANPSRDPTTHLCGYINLTLIQFSPHFVSVYVCVCVFECLCVYPACARNKRSDLELSAHINHTALWNLFYLWCSIYVDVDVYIR